MNPDDLNNPNIFSLSYQPGQPWGGAPTTSPYAMTSSTTPFGRGSWDALGAGVPGPGSGAPTLSALGKLGSFFGKNGQTIGAWANAIGQGVNAYVGLQQLGLAKDALKFEKKSFKTNLANQVDSYNTQMRDRISGRYYATEEERQAALKEAELPQGMRG